MWESEGDVHGPGVHPDKSALSAWRDVEAARRLVADRAELGAVGEQARPDARTLAILGRAMAVLDAAMARVET